MGMRLIPQFLLKAFRTSHRDYNSSAPIRGHPSQPQKKE